MFNLRSNSFTYWIFHLSLIWGQKLKITGKRDIFINTTYPSNTINGAYSRSPCSFGVLSQVPGDQIYVQVLNNVPPAFGCVRNWDPKDGIFKCVATAATTGGYGYPATTDTLESFCSSEAWRITPNAFFLMGLHDNGSIVADTKNSRFAVRITSDNMPNGAVNMNITVIYKLTARDQQWFPMLGSYTGTYRSVRCRNGTWVTSVSSRFPFGSATYFYGLDIVCSDVQGGSQTLSMGALKPASDAVQQLLVACPYSISGLSVKQSKDLYGSYFQSYPPNGLAFTCARKQASNDTSWFGYHASQDEASTYTCPPNSSIIGFQGYLSADSDRINGFSPICGRVKVIVTTGVTRQMAVTIIAVSFGLCLTLVGLLRCLMVVPSTSDYNRSG